MAGSVLSVYSLGLLFFSLQKVLSSVFFAKGDTRTPVFSSLFAVIVEGFLGFIFAFVFKLGVIGLVLGTASSSLAGFGFLLYFWKEREFNTHSYIPSLLKAFLSTLLMCLFLVAIKPNPYELFYAIPLASLIYWISLLLLKEPLALSVLHLLKSLVKKLAES